MAEHEQESGPYKVILELQRFFAGEVKNVRDETLRHAERMHSENIGRIARLEDTIREFAEETRHALRDHYEEDDTRFALVNKEVGKAFWYIAIGIGLVFAGEFALGLYIASILK